MWLMDSVAPDDKDVIHDDLGLMMMVDVVVYGAGRIGSIVIIIIAKLLVTRLRCWP